MLMRVPRRVTDFLVAAIVGLVALVQVVHSDHHLPVTVPLALVASAAIFLRNGRPLAVLAVVTAANIVFLHTIGGWLAPVELVAAITVAMKHDRRTSGRAIAVVALVLGLELLRRNHWHVTNLVPLLILLGAAWVFGENMNARERERERRVTEAAAAERARVAREIHDVVTHNVSVMVVQAAAGREVFDARPDQASAALSAIEDTGRSALTELRRLLDVDGGDAETVPQPSLSRLDELVARVRATGLQVALDVEGTPRPVPEGVGLSVYRIVQESLTNTLKHARATHAAVVVRYRGDAVEVEVTDDGVGAQAPGDGRGLVGMRERVALYGGELDAGSVPAGGFRVRALLPVGAA